MGLYEQAHVQIEKERREAALRIQAFFKGYLLIMRVRNRRLVAAMVELKFDELLEEGPESCGPCSCLPFCA